MHWRKKIKIIQKGHRTFKYINGIYFLVIITLITISSVSFENGASISESINDAGSQGSPTINSRSVNGTGMAPKLVLNKTYDPPSIWISGSINQPQETRVRLSLTGEGDPRIIFDPQDIVFVMDSSGSMDLSDPANYRYSAARGYVENLLPPDQAAVIQFGYEAWLVNDHHLSFDYEQVIEDLAEDPKYKGQTNYEAAIALANKELIENGDADSYWIQIFFTDGNPDPKSNNVTLETIQEAIDYNITIYTVGLEWQFAPNPLDEGLLKWMANSTGGEYFKAAKPDELVEIYENISRRFTVRTAGSDTNTSDSEPMVREVLPGYIEVNTDSFSIKPDYIGSGFNGSTILEWNVSNIDLGETWFVEFNISSSLAGNVTTSIAERSRVKYTMWNGSEAEDHFEPMLLWVKKLPPPPPPPISPPPPPPPPAIGPGGGVPPPNPSLPVINPVITIQPQLLPVAFESTVTIPVGFALAGFAALGIMERIKMKQKIKGKHKVAIGA